MDEEKFMEMEYQYLRNESFSLRDRLLKLAIISMAVLPSIQAAIDKWKLGLLITIFPLFIIAIFLLYLSESRAIMRIGSYIKLNIESKYEGKGWESWLSDKKHKRRFVDKALSYYFLCMFLFYYFISVCKAIEELKNPDKVALSSSWLNFLIMLYLLLAIVLIVLWFFHNKKITTTAKE